MKNFRGEIEFDHVVGEDEHGNPITVRAPVTPEVRFEKLLWLCRLVRPRTEKLSLAESESFDVRYILESSVRNAGDRIRLTAQLIDAEDGDHVRAERYDRSLDDVIMQSQ